MILILEINNYFFDELKIFNEDLIIDCFDNSESRKIIADLDKNNQFDILHMDFSPQYTAVIIWNNNYSVPNDIHGNQNDICEMTDIV